MKLRLCHQKSLIPSPQHTILASRKRIVDPVDNDLHGEMREVLESQLLKQCSNRVVLPDDGQQEAKIEGRASILVSVVFSTIKC